MSDSKIDITGRNSASKVNTVVSDVKSTTVEQSSATQMQEADVILASLDSYDGSRDGAIQKSTILHSELAREVGLDSKDLKALLASPDAPETLSVAEIRQNLKLHFEGATDTPPSPPRLPVSEGHQEYKGVERSR